MTLLSRIAETIDAELRRQNLASQWIGDLDPESIAVAVMNHIADALSAEGWQAPARWLKAETVSK